MNELESGVKKRNIAYKMRIGDILKAKPVIADGKFLFLELGDKQIVRINIIANVVDKFISDNAEKRYASITVDDASGQIRLKAFAEDVEKLKNFTQGDTLQIVGVVREYNNELYILPEIVKSIDTRWLLVRKLEMQESKENLPIKNSTPLRDTLIDKIKASEKDGGMDVDTLIMELDSNPTIINQEIKKLLEEGLIYEPRPGKLRYLG